VSKSDCGKREEGEEAFHGVFFFAGAFTGLTG
jgi:hypothetical protein